jgi:hypothetical protein
MHSHLSLIIRGIVPVLHYETDLFPTRAMNGFHTLAVTEHGPKQTPRYHAVRLEFLESSLHFCKLLEHEVVKDLEFTKRLVVILLGKFGAGCNILVRKNIAPGRLVIFFLNLVFCGTILLIRSAFALRVLSLGSGFRLFCLLAFVLVRLAVQYLPFAGFLVLILILVLLILILSFFLLWGCQCCKFGKSFPACV